MYSVAMACFPLRGKTAALPENVSKNPAAIAQELAKVLNGLPYFDEVRAQGPYVNMSYDTALQLLEFCAGYNERNTAVLLNNDDFSLNNE